MSLMYKVHHANSEKLSDFICRWQELSDTGYNYINITRYDKLQPCRIKVYFLGLEVHVYIHG